MNKKAELSLKGGHPWVYGAEAVDREPCENGAVADVFSEKGTYLGSGLCNDQSKILVRVLSKNANDAFDEAFFRRRIRYAIDYRKTVMGEDFSACRLIFGEADGLPGWTVDRFESVLVTEVLSLGIEVRKGMLFRLLLEELQKDGVEIDVIYERNESPLRLKEGLEQGKGYVDLPGLKTEGDGLIEITENGVRYEVDYVNGQKTGFFLDQKQNRAALAPLCRDAKVLDCFCHNGSFSLHAAKFGAKSVLGVDISEEALDVARKNARINGFANVTFETHNCFDLLRELTDAGEQYDLVILDPPAFTKNKAAVQSAIRGYKEINLRGLKLTRPGGFLVTCSCSQHVLPEMFQDVICQAARDAKKRVRLVEYRTQGYDHPILPQSVETRYLKTMILQVFD